MRKLTAVVLTAIVAVTSLAIVSRAETVDDPISTGLDANAAGNAATVLGTVEHCREVGLGASFDIDLYVIDIPPSADGKGGVMGFSYNLLFDPAVLEVTAVDNFFLTQAGGDTDEFNAIDADYVSGENPDADPLPGTTGNVRVDNLDLSETIESGTGVLSRITLHSVGAGRSSVTLADDPYDVEEPMIVSSAALASPDQGRYPILSVQNITVAVNEPCGIVPTASATPLTPTETPALPTETPVDTPEPTLEPTGSPQPTPTGGTGLIWGNSDCDGTGITTRDNQALLRQVLQQPPLSQTEPCPDLGEAFGSGIWGDWDCSGEITARDNQALLRFVLSQTPLGQTELCADIGAVPTVS